MILVTVGTQKFPFNRLLKKVDELVEEKIITDKVFAQIGQSTYKPKNCKWVDFLEERAFNELIQSCDILITHGGIGTITKGLIMKKKIIIVPRMKEFHEHVDNHQIEIGDEFSKMRYTMTCKDIDQLDVYLKQLNELQFREYNFSYQNIADYIQKYLVTLEEK